MSAAALLQTPQQNSLPCEQSMLDAKLKVCGLAGNLPGMFQSERLHVGEVLIFRP